MGLLDGLMGNASEVDAVEMNQEFAQVLAPGERIVLEEHALQHRNGRALRPGCGAEDLDFRRARAHPEAVQQEAEHLRSSGRPGLLRALEREAGAG